MELDFYEFPQFAPYDEERSYLVELSGGRKRLFWVADWSNQAQTFTDSLDGEPLTSMSLVKRWAALPID